MTLSNPAPEIVDWCECCGEPNAYNDLEECLHCGDLFCQGCIDIHEEMCGADRCVECGVIMDVDPPCPICGDTLCDDCFEEHVRKCKRKTEIGRQQSTLVRWLF